MMNAHYPKTSVEPIHVVLAALIIGITLVGTALFGIQDVLYWQQHGIPAKGEVLDRFVKEECQGGGSGSGTTCLDNFYLVYRYQTQQGTAFKGQDGVNQTLWNAHAKGADVSLLYSAIQPDMSSISYAGDSNVQKLLWVLVLATGGVLILIAVVLLIMRK